MPPLLNPAPPWAPDRSDFVILWHGCTALEKNLIELHDVDSSAGRVNTDFGRGFYTTTLERQARQWAWDRFYDWKAKNPLATANQPVVLRFRVRRFGTVPRSSDLDDGLDQLKSLHFVLGDYDSEDYWSLVQHCRQSIPANPSLGIVEVINHHEWRRAGFYDLVTGPVASFWRQRVAMTGADQVSFHTKRATDLLNARLTSGLGGNVDDYRWDPVI